MARLYTDEQFPRRVVELLPDLGDDVLTVQEAGNAGLKISDEEVLVFAISNDRAILTLNRQDFFKLHRLQPNHGGIIACKDDRDMSRMATLIHEAITAEESFQGKLIRVNRPG